MPEAIQNAAIGAFLHPASPALEEQAGNNQDVEPTVARIDYIMDENDQSDYCEAIRFRTSDKGRTFEKQYKDELTQLSDLITSDLLSPVKVEDLRQNVEIFKQNLFGSADHYSSKTWMMFSLARDNINAITTLLSSPEIENLEKTIALDRATGEMDQCADGVLSNLKAARLRLECVVEGGATAVLESIVFQQIEAEAQSFAQQIYGGIENFEGDEIHIVNAFKDYAITIGFQGLEVFRSGDALAPFYVRNTTDDELDVFSNRLHASITPGSTMKKWAAQHLEVLHSVIAKHFLDGNLVDNVKIEKGFTVEQMVGDLNKDLDENVVAPLQQLLSVKEKSHFVITELMDDEHDFSWNDNDVITFTKSEQKLAELLIDVAGPFIKSTWPDTLALPEKITELRATRSSLHHMSGVKFWVKSEPTETTRAPCITDLIQVDLHTLLPSLAVDLIRRALDEAVTADELIAFVSGQISGLQRDPESPFSVKNPAIELSVTQAVQEKAGTDSTLRARLVLNIQGSQTTDALVAIQLLVGMSSELKAVYVDRTFQLVPPRTQLPAQTQEYTEDLDVLSRLSENSLRALAQESYALAALIERAVSIGHVGAVRNILTANDETVNEHTLSIAFDACRQGHFEVVELLLDNEVDVHRQDGREKMQHTTLMHAASTSGSVAVMALLLSKGGNCNVRDSDGATPATIAYQKNMLEMVELLLDNGAYVNVFMPDDNTPLTYACEHDRPELITLLLAKGANVNTPRRDGCLPLAVACENSYLETAEQLIDNGAIIDTLMLDGTTPLHSAFFSDPPEAVVRLLLARGADVNLSKEGVPKPLDAACARGIMELVQELLDKGAEVNPTEQTGSTPLIQASVFGDARIVKLLLDYGANINTADSDGDTPLILACDEMKPEVVELLLARGADIHQSNLEGDTPLKAACRVGNLEVLEMVRNKLDIG